MYEILVGFLEFLYQKIPQQHKINTSRALSTILRAKGRISDSVYVPWVHSVLVFSGILLIPINEMYVSCQNFVHPYLKTIIFVKAGAWVSEPV
jgi:hypothetical protein